MGQHHLQAYLQQIRKRWRGWQIVLVLDRGSPHTAYASRQQAPHLGIELRFLPTATPELNPLENLWRYIKDTILANEATPDVVAAVERASTALLELAPQERLGKSGVLAPNFWLKGVL